MPSLNIEYIFLKIYDFFTGVHTVGHFVGLRNTLIVIGIIISVVFLYIIVYSVTRLKERRAEEHRKWHHEILEAGAQKEEKVSNKNWQIVIDFITSANPSDWRLAVIEADNMLDELTKRLGLSGNNLGERLTNAPKGQFQSLDNAWEGHKLRNKIAHEGMGYTLEYKEAKHAIEQFEKVFEEFKFL